MSERIFGLFLFLTKFICEDYNKSILIPYSAFWHKTLREQNGSLGVFFIYDGIVVLFSFSWWLALLCDHKGIFYLKEINAEDQNQRWIVIERCRKIAGNASDPLRVSALKNNHAQDKLPCAFYIDRSRMASPNFFVREALWLPVFI